MAATGRAHEVGSGENAHEWAHQLRALVDLEDDGGRPLTITVAEPLTAHGQRLADSLGVRVEVTPVTSTIANGRSMGNYIVPGPSFAKSDGPRADWIDYRASVARVHHREQHGDEPLTCSGCGTETDVTDVVHSPKCVTVAPVEKRASAWTPAEAIAAMQAWATEHGQTPSLDDWRVKAPGRPTQAVVVQLFGSWLDGVRATGLEPRRRGRPKRTADADAREEAAAVLRELHERRELEQDSSSEGAVDPESEEGPRSPTPTDGGLDDEQPGVRAPTPAATADGSGESEQLPAPDPVRSRAGAGPAVKWTSEIIVDLVRLWAEQHDGQPPTSSDWQAGDRAWPSVASCVRQFGSFAAAIEAAGFEKPTRGRRRGAARKNSDEAAGQISRVEAVSASDESEAAVPARERPVTSPETTGAAGAHEPFVADLEALRARTLAAVNAFFAVLDEVESIVKQVRP